MCTTDRASNTPITRLLGADVEIKMSKGGGLLCGEMKCDAVTAIE